MLRIAVIVVLSALVTTACADDELETAESYLEELVRIGEQFNSVERGGPGDDELIVATILFAAYEDAYDALAGLRPPEDLADDHAAFVAAFADVQRLAAEYVGEGSMAGEFSLESLNADAAFGAAFRSMMEACGVLQRHVAGIVEGPLPATCNF